MSNPDESRFANFPIVGRIKDHLVLQPDVGWYVLAIFTIFLLFILILIFIHLLFFKILRREQIRSHFTGRLYSEQKRWMVSEMPLFDCNGPFS